MVLFPEPVTPASRIIPWSKWQSVSIDGVCQTVVAVEGGAVTFEAIQETLTDAGLECLLASDGSEAFAYVPPNLLSVIYRLWLQGGQVHHNPARSSSTIPAQCACDRPFMHANQRPQ